MSITSDTDHEFFAEREADAQEEAKAEVWERAHPGKCMPESGVSTPEWRIVQEEGSWYVRVDAPYPDDLYVCRLSAWGPRGSGDLISAAPDLLEALKDCERALSEYLHEDTKTGVPPRLRNIRAAIAKAEGRS